MKKIQGLLCLILAIVFTTSCSENGKMVGLLEQLPADADVVMVGNFNKIMESAGGSLEGNKIKLPSNITSKVPEAADGLDDVNSFLKKSGIDLDACALTADFEKGRPVIVFAINDTKQFTSAIEKEGYKEKDSEDGVVFYTKKVYESESGEYDDISYIAVKGSYAYFIESVWVGSDFKPVKFIKKLVEDAKEKNYASTKRGDYIVSGNAGGIAFTMPKEAKQEMRKAGVPSEFADLYDGTLCFTGNLADDEMTLDFKFFDENDKEIKTDKFKEFADYSAKVNGDALKFHGKDEFIIAAASLKDFKWDKYFDMVSETAGLSRSDRAVINAATGYLEKIDGTISFGFGLTDGIESIKKMTRGEDVLSQFSTTIVVETKEGKGKKLVEDMKGFMEQSGVPFNESGAGFTIEVPEVGGMLYCKCEDNFIVLGNHPIKSDNSNAVLDKFNMTKYISAFCIGLTKDSKMMKDLGVKSDVMMTTYAQPNSVSSHFSLKIENDKKGGVIEKFADIIISLASKVEELQGELYQPYSYEDDYYDADTVAVDDYYYDEPEPDSDEYYYE